MNRRGFLSMLVLGPFAAWQARRRECAHQRAIQAMVRYQDKVFRLMDEAKIDIYRLPQ